MALPLRFGILAPQVVPVPVQLERWRELDELGFDSVWLADHFVNPNMPAGRWFDGWTLLAAIAMTTRRIQMGALVASITFHHPAFLAKQALTIDHLSEGRLELGLGAGGAPNDITMTGLDEWPAGERATRFRESVEILDLLLREPTASYAGRYYRIRGAEMNPGPVQEPRPPFTLAAHGPTTMRVVAKHAQTWNCLASGASGRHAPQPQTSAACVAAVRALNERMTDACVAAGRDPATLRRSILAGGGVTPDNPWASADAFEDFVGRYREVGIDEFIFYYPSRAEQAAGWYERIARAMLPALRRS
jgi:alkanesulfonate monooxygenase SsuD/methylene tetrahydromethanopterin reductase-like flavin-dependent oxidoreductase (luciferase family)